MKSARPTSSYSVKHSMVKTPGKLLTRVKEDEEPLYDPIKQLEMEKRHEDALYRNSVTLSVDFK